MKFYAQDCPKVETPEEQNKVLAKNLQNRQFMNKLT